jgi:hypothetical protein
MSHHQSVSRSDYGFSLSYPIVSLFRFLICKENKIQKFDSISLFIYFDEFSFTAVGAPDSMVSGDESPKKSNARHKKQIIHENCLTEMSTKPLLSADQM